MLPIPPATYDITIIGGGLVGASLAVALADLPLRIALIEAAQPPAFPPAWDERCIALNDGSRRIFEDMGVWPTLAPQLAQIRATHISERGKFGVARFSAEECGLDALGYNTPLRAIGAALMAKVAAAPHITLLCPAKLAGLQLGSDVAQLSLGSPADAASPVLSSRLVVAADGAGSSVRALLGLHAEVRDYAQTAIVTGLRVYKDPAGVAYERFLPSGPFAVLPKPRIDDAPGHPCSLIWTLPTAEAAAMQALPDDAFLAAAQQAFGERLGRFLAVGKRIAWPLARTVNQTPTAQRVVFCGNAAQSLHPVAAQGFNLGLRDVAALAASLRSAVQQGSDIGSADLLSAYASAREQDRSRTAGFTDQLVRVFSNRTPLLAQLRHWGLLGLQLTPPLREQVLRQNLGHVA